MSVRTARAISLGVIVIAALSIIVTIPAGLIATRDGSRDTIIVVPAATRDAIRDSIEEGGGCPEPTVDDELADAATSYCRLQDRLEDGPLTSLDPSEPFTIIAFLIGGILYGRMQHKTLSHFPYVNLIVVSEKARTAALRPNHQ